MRYLRRLIWYLGTRLLILVSVLGLLTVSFYFSMNAANIYVVVKDGMAQRAQTVMMGGDEQNLLKYFSAGYLTKDNVLAAMRNHTNPYERFSVTGIDHRINIEWVWSWPWDDTARATFTERIPLIDGRILSSYKQTTPEDQWAVPRWQSRRYSAVLAHEQGQWKIKSMETLGAVNDK